MSCARSIYSLELNHEVFTTFQVFVFCFRVLLRMDVELTQETVTRYSRQLLLENVNLTGQKNLCNASIAVVGAGGLGCPVSLYCAAAGVGCIGIIDHDSVELSNLHRQIAHDVDHLGVLKVESLEQKLKSLNPLVDIKKFPYALTQSNVFDILMRFDLVVDCSDNAATRYLVSDACVILKKTLVSASALRLEGQLSVFKPHENNMPCYRCIYPEAPDPSLMGNCSSVGVMGFVCGVMGSLQAQEVIKELIGLPGTLVGKMLIYDAVSCSFRSIKLRSKRTDCVCAKCPTRLDHFQNVVQQCTSVMLLEDGERLTATDYQNILNRSKSHLLIDVRSSHELLFSNYIPTCASFLNLPLKKLTSQDNSLVVLIEEKMKNLNESNLIVVRCKMGNSSQKAVNELKKLGLAQKYELKDIKGGLMALKETIADSNIFSY